MCFAFLRFWWVLVGIVINFLRASYTTGIANGKRSTCFECIKIKLQKQQTGFRKKLMYFRGISKIDDFLLLAKFCSRDISTIRYRTQVFEHQLLTHQSKILPTALATCKKPTSDDARRRLNPIYQVIIRSHSSVKLDLYWEMKRFALPHAIQSSRSLTSGIASKTRYVCAMAAIRAHRSSLQRKRRSDGWATGMDSKKGWKS